MYPVPPSTANRSNDWMKIRLLKSSEATDVQRVWRALENQSGSVRLSTSWKWVETWLEVYGRSVPHWFAIGSVGDSPVGICLITCSGPPLLRRLGIGLIQVGTTGEPIGHSVGTEYNDVLVCERYRTVFAKQLLQTIRHQLWPIAIRLPAFSTSDIQAFTHVEHGLSSRNVPSPVFDLHRARDLGVEPAALLRPSVRARIRRSMKALQPIETEWADTVEHAYEIFDDLIVLHQDRWRRAGRQGAFFSHQFTAFHRSLIPKLLPENRAVLFRVRHGAQTVGALYCLVDGDSVLFYQSGFAQFEDNKIRPGLTTHILCMEACLSRGFRTYNFLAGDERYKGELSTSLDMLVNARAPGYPVFAPLFHFAFHPNVREGLRALKHHGERLAVTFSRRKGLTVSSGTQPSQRRPRSVVTGVPRRPCGGAAPSTRAADQANHV